MTSLALDVRPAAWAEPSPLRALLQDTLAVTEIELRKIRHDPVDLVTRAVQPVLWLLVFGEVLAATRAIPTGSLPYLAFLTPGVLAQSALFAAIFYGITIIWERDLGVVHKYLVTPASRTSLVAGKALASGVRSLSQALIITILALVLGVGVSLDPIRLAGVALVVILGSAAFSLFSLSIACLVRNRDRVMSVGQLLTMPLFFASSAIYPVAVMPPWLQAIAVVNPLTYMVSALRMLMVEPVVDWITVLFDVAVLGGFAVVLLMLTARLYPRVVV